MARTPQTALVNVLAIAPGGWALPQNPDSNWGYWLGPIASAWCDVEASGESLVHQVDPRNATTLLPDWLALFSPDPCGRDIGALPQSQQQLYCYQRLTARGGQSIGYLVSLAASLGVAATITEGGWSRCGTCVCGDRLYEPGDQFSCLVTLPQTEFIAAVCGDSQCGDHLGSFEASLAVCPIEHAAPAHVNVGFSYSG